MTERAAVLLGRRICYSPSGVVYELNVHDQAAFDAILGNFAEPLPLRLGIQVRLWEANGLARGALSVVPDVCIQFYGFGYDLIT